MKVGTLEEALEYVQSVGVCTLFSGKAKGVPALWDVVDLPEEGGGRTNWGAKVEAIWAWKNELHGSVSRRNILREDSGWTRCVDDYRLPRRISLRQGS